MASERSSTIVVRRTESGLEVYQNGKVVCECFLIKKDGDLVVCGLLGDSPGAGPVRALLKVVKELAKKEPLVVAIEEGSPQSSKLTRLYQRFGAKKYITIYKVE